MKSSQLNHIIHPRKFANKEGEVKFNWQVKDFSNLCDALYDHSGDIKVVIRGRHDLQHRCLLETHIQANLTLECQTSFEPMAHHVDNTVTYCTVIKEEQIATVDDEYEPVLIEDGLLDIKKLIEDELILSIPIAANKPADELTQKMSFGELDEKAIAEEEARSNPFSVLTGLKK